MVGFNSNFDKIENVGMTTSFHISFSEVVIYFSLEQDNIYFIPFDFKQKIWFLKIGIIGIEISCLISRRSRIRPSEERS